MIFIQHIRTTWKKDSRGMPQAAKRSGMPDRFKLPIDALSQLDNDDHLLVQDISVQSSTCVHHAIPIQTIPVHMTNTQKMWDYHGLQCVQDKQQPDKLAVFFRYSYHKHGQPKRHNSQIFSFEYANKAHKKGHPEWGTFKINGRYTYGSGQFYRQHIYHILFVEDIVRIPQDLFSTTQPKRTQDYLAHLF